VSGSETKRWLGVVINAGFRFRSPSLQLFMLRQSVGSDDKTDRIRIVGRENLVTIRRVAWLTSGPATLIACLLGLICQIALGQAPGPSRVVSGVDAEDLVGSFAPPETEVPPSVYSPSLFSFDGSTPDPPRVKLGLLETIGTSLFGDAVSRGRWRPLSLGTIFTEGWREPWVRAPAGREGLTPRQGWINAFDGVIFSPLVVGTFGYTNKYTQPFGGNRYAETFSSYLPFSRRFQMLFNVPVLVSNGTSDPKRGYTTQFGDLIVAPRILLMEDVSSAQVFVLAIRTPTGTHATVNEFMGLTPRHEFWTNPVGPWVLKGANGFFVPLNRAKTKGPSTFTGGLALGRYFRPHDVPFGDLVFYCESTYTAPLDGTASRNTAVTVGPGTRFHITDNFFFLANCDFPVTRARAGTCTLQFAVVKSF
jgi:hypothetical protein